MGTRKAAQRERISARVPKEVRERIEAAAYRSGATLNQFVVQAAIEKAEHMLERERMTQLSVRDGLWLLSILDRPPRPPNARLKRALKLYQKATGGDSNRAFDWPPRSDEV